MLAASSAIQEAARLASTGRLAEAESALRAGLASAPGNADLWQNLGACLARTGRLPEAAQALNESLRLRPGSLPVLDMLFQVLMRANDPAPAEQVLLQARRLAPGDPNLAYRYAHVLQLCGRIGESARAYLDLVRAFPDNPDLRLGAAILLSYWDQGDPDEIRAHLEHRGRLLVRAAPPSPPFDNPRDPERRVRIGFLCQDIRKDSAIARFVAAPALHLDRERFELRGYCTQPTMAQMTERLSGALPWVDVSALNDDALLARLRADQIDVLVETIGNTPGNRAAALARRAAPVQVSCTGDPRTTGLPTMDYRIVDEITDPPGSERFCTEKLWRLPGCFASYEPHDDAPPPRPPIGDEPVVFGSFNVQNKVGPRTVGAWARILAQVPGSRLILRGYGFQAPSIRTMYEQMFRGQGLDPARVEMSGTIPAMGEHLAQYRRIHIGLDPFPYNGTTTSCDCLWQGVPLVAFAGSWHAARVGASLLTAIGMPDLVAPDVDGYVRIAVELAHARNRLAEIHRTLRARMAASPLGDAPRCALALGDAYRATWRAYCAS